MQVVSEPPSETATTAKKRRHSQRAVGEVGGGEMRSNAGGLQGNHSESNKN